MNVFSFNGNIAKEIEIKETNTGKKVVAFSVAINEGKDKTEFVNIVAWEKTAELLHQYCKKGDRLAGVGRLQTRKYDDNNGVTKYVTEVVLNQFDFPPKNSGSEDTTAIKPKDDPVSAGSIFDDSDIPF